jgi:ribosome-binding factor A
MKPASQRQLRVGEQIRHILADTLRGGFFYNHNGVAGEFSGGGVIVAEVRPSPDLKQAKVYISTVKPEDLTETLKILNDNSFMFQKEIGRQMRRLPIPPRLMRFYIRSAVRIGNKLFTLIHHSVFIFL